MHHSMKKYLPIGIILGIALSLGGVAYAGTLIQNNQLANDNVTVNGTSVVLGGSGTITANTTNSLSVSGSITGTSFNGSAAVSNWALNMANANTWTALQTFGNSTTTRASFSYASSTAAYFGYESLKDTVHGWTGTVSPTRAFSVGLATSTAWLATSTAPYNLNAQMVLPFTGTLRQAVCNTNAGTLTVQLTIAGVSHYITGVAVTPATTTFSGVTFGEGAKFSMNAGNPATSPQSVTCTLYATITP